MTVDVIVSVCSVGSAWVIDSDTDSGVSVGVGLSMLSVVSVLELPSDFTLYVVDS